MEYRKAASEFQLSPGSPALWRTVAICAPPAVVSGRLSPGWIEGTCACSDQAGGGTVSGEAVSLPRDRQMSEPVTGCGKDGVADRRQDWRQRRFAKPSRGIGRLQVVNLDWRSLGELYEPMIVEVRLNDAPPGKRDLLKHLTHAIDDRSLGQILDRPGIDNLT